jgi:hypothetical protein
MKYVLVILAVQMSMIGALVACGCSGPKDDLRTDIDSSDAIFVGVITKISKDHIFHLNNGYGTGLKFINFDVLKSYKGLNQALLKVTLFDSRSNSSCEGICFGKEVGDTVLVFAREFSQWMLGSYLCGRHPTFQRLSPEESHFIDTAQWTDPRTKYLNAEKFIQKIFPKSTELNENECTKSGLNLLRLIISLSAGINLILGFLLFRKKRNV